MSRLSKFRALPVMMALALALLGTGTLGAAAQSKDAPKVPVAPASAQVILGNPLTITVLDNTQVAIEFTNTLVGQNHAHQFYSNYADGIFLWAAHDAVSAPKVYGPSNIPGGNNVNAYNAVSNALSGAGTPDDPWVVTTVNDVPNTKLRMTMYTSYVNGAEYVKMEYKLEQMGGTYDAPVTLFHAADLHTAADELGTGYYNAATGGVGDFFTPTALNMYQQFVPTVPVTKYQEATYETIWDKIGEADAPGPGFNNTIVSTPHDTAVGLQWDVTVPTDGNEVVGDIAFFGPHENLAGSFSDVSSDAYYYDYIYYLGTHGIASGYSDGTFRPGNNATRGQLAKMVVLAMGWPIDTTQGPHFIDVPEWDTFYPFVETAYNHGIVAGYSDGTFRAYANVTRAQTVKMTVLAQGWTINLTGAPHFADVPADNPFYGYIETAYNAGIISGYSDGTFRPNTNVTRGQISKIIDPTRMLAR